MASPQWRAFCPGRNVRMCPLASVSDAVQYRAHCSLGLYTLSARRSLLGPKETPMPWPSGEERTWEALSKEGRTASTLEGSRGLGRRACFLDATCIRPGWGAQSRNPWTQEEVAISGAWWLRTSVFNTSTQEAERQGDEPLMFEASGCAVKPCLENKTNQKSFKYI